MIQIHVNIAGHEKINEPVAVVIGPCCSGAETVHLHASVRSNVFEFTSAKIAIENIVPVTGYVKIGKPIIIVVTYGNRHSPAASCEPGGGGDVSKVDIAAV